MDKRFIKETIEFYQDQRFLSFYKKREKAILIPHLSFYIDRLMNSKRKKKDNIKVLDIGCGPGNLLEIIETIFHARYPQKQLLSLYGLDQDIDLIKEAKKKNSKKTYFIKDLQVDDLGDLKERFDIITVVNTLHEVFSSLLSLGREKGNGVSRLNINHAKSRIHKIISNLSALLSKEGVLLIFDGLEPSGSLTRKVKFKITNPILRRYLRKFKEEFSPWHLSIERIAENVYQADKRDFTRFVTTFKFLNSKLWPIESKESYQFFTKKEFIRAMEEANLLVESVNIVSNDLGLYKGSVEIITPGVDFPDQSVLIVGGKKYIVTEFDYFCSEQNTFI